MSRNYTVTENVGRPSKYSEQDFIDIINKKELDTYFAKKFHVSQKTIQGIRSNAAKRLKINPSSKWKNQEYRGKKMVKYDRDEYHRARDCY